MAEQHSTIRWWSARNPLGIVALFISLIYGMSALLLGTAVSILAPHNQTILVTFIASFPFVVLGVFAWLVASHHRKLYGPGDYRSDESFLSAGGPISPLEFRTRIDETVSAADSPEEPESTEAPLSDQPNKPAKHPNGSSTAISENDRSSIAARAYELSPNLGDGRGQAAAV